MRVGLGLGWGLENKLRKMEKIKCTPKPLMAILDITRNQLSSDFVGIYRSI